MIDTRQSSGVQQSLKLELTESINLLFCRAQVHREAKPQGQGSCAICFTGLATPQQGHLHAYDCKKILRQNQLHIAKISSRLLKTQISGKPTALPPQNTSKPSATQIPPWIEKDNGQQRDIALQSIAASARKHPQSFWESCPGVFNWNSRDATEAMVTDMTLLQNAEFKEAFDEFDKVPIKHRKNCECCPVSQLIVR